MSRFSDGPPEGHVFKSVASESSLEVQHSVIGAANAASKMKQFIAPAPGPQAGEVQ
jgi:hypothetical protein